MLRLVRSLFTNLTLIIPIKCYLSWIEYFRASVDYFGTAVETFLETLPDVDVNDLMALRKVNDRLMNLERYFIDPNGLPDRPETK